MLLPKFFQTKLRLFKWANGGLLILCWLLQVLRVSLGPIQPLRTLRTLLIFTLAYVGILCSPRLIKDRFEAPTRRQMSLDLNVLFIIYALIFLLLPQALDTAYLASSQAGLGILFSLLGVPMPYIRPNGVYGIRLPWTRNSTEIWLKTNILGARLLLVVGVVSLIVGSYQANWFLMSLTIGVIIFTAATVGYAYHQSRP